MAQRHQAAAMLQAVVRGHFTRLAVETLKRETTAVVCIQAAWRRWMATESVVVARMVRQQQDGAARVIQAVVRGCVVAN